MGSGENLPGGLGIYVCYPGIIGVPRSLLEDSGTSNDTEVKFVTTLL